MTAASTITPRKTGGAVSLPRALHMAWTLSLRDMSSRYASSYAGALWNIAAPLLQSLVTMAVFSILMNGRMGDRYGDVPFPVFFFVALSLWQPFSEIVARASGILPQYKFLISKIVYPVWTLPLVTVPSAILNQLIVLAIAVALMIYYGIAPGPLWWGYLVATAVMLLLGIGIAYSVSAFAAYVPDVAQLTPIVLTILFWLTPILYSPAIVETGGVTAARAVIMDYNPLYHIVENARHSVFGTAAPNWLTLGSTSFVALLFLFFGIAMFRKLRPGFADIL